MELRDKHILIVSPEGWRGLNMSKHHVAQGLLARGNRVCFWGPSQVATRSLHLEEEGGLRTVHAPHWFKGVNRLPRFVNQWYYGRMIRAIERAAAAPFDIVWCFDTSRMQWFPNGPWYKLLHLVDYDILYHGHGLMRTADLIVTTAEIINTRVLEIAPGANVHKIGHALDPRWLLGAEDLDAPRTGPPRTALYAGQFFNTYIDFDALVRVAETHPGIAFKYVGTFVADFPNVGFQRLRRMPNVEFTGLKTKDQLLPLVRSADLLLFCFMTDQRTLERANPHKVLEYLSTGNTIVGSWTLEYADHQHLLVMAREQNGYARSFEEAVARFTELNSREHRAERIAFAEQRTIPHLLDRIEDLARR